MKKTIGILAHVDAGKTTFSEQLLYHTGSIRNLGRVDNKTSFFDTDTIEQNRGITIFADQGVFTYKGDTYYLIDTPGHVDFSGETERVISSLDYAVLLISGSSGVQAHTTTLFRLLKAYKIPAFFFINKCDVEGFSLENILWDIQDKLTKDCLHLYSLDLDQIAIAEFVAERDETFMVSYLDNNYTKSALQKTLIELVKKQECFPVTCGSALKNIGIDLFMELFSSLSHTDYEEQIRNTFSGRIFKIRHDDSGNRLTFVKAYSGKLQVKDEFIFERDGETYKEKVNEIRIYNGSKFERSNIIAAGDIFAVAGLKTPTCGSILETGNVWSNMNEKYYLTSALQSRIKILDSTDITKCLEKIRLLEAEDPMLSVSLQEENKDILVQVMGKIQLEVLEETIHKRFGILVSFEKPQVQYKETIKSAVIGYGHFEPLRHYAEVQLRLEPNPRGIGMTFASECHVDNLALNYQHLIETHIFEKEHKGILTGSSITDINIVLQDGRAHIKHTEGGDFREATYRAIRQGLEEAR
ncbi:small GTP-binding protein [Mobilisporobacter senegalensis]|uniref:Small GTP-binding protein n=1 Tax=Mobilisporobacter senegalensis TaxID=1329262 RepID=A0A3N1XKM8_9FIRM|nr:small GTP-binding protein [Mobilisporobacter senegalensis]